MSICLPNQTITSLMAGILFCPPLHSQNLLQGLVLDNYLVNICHGFLAFWPGGSHGNSIFSFFGGTASPPPSVHVAWVGLTDEQAQSLAICISHPSV